MLCSLLLGTCLLLYVHDSGRIATRSDDSYSVSMTYRDVQTIHNYICFDIRNNH